MEYTKNLELPLPAETDTPHDSVYTFRQALGSLDSAIGADRAAAIAARSEIDSQFSAVGAKLSDIDKAQQGMWDILDAKAKALTSTESGELSVSIQLVESMIQAAALERSKREHPVGSYYTSDQGTDPAEIFGFGTWERVKGVVLLGADEDAYPAGSEGGEAEHTLTVKEIPSHTHGLMRYTGTDDQNWSGHLENGVCANDSPNYSAANTNATGGGTPHNNMMPYRSVYCWRRTA